MQQILFYGLVLGGCQEAANCEYRIPKDDDIKNINVPRPHCYLLSFERDEDRRAARNEIRNVDDPYNESNFFTVSSHQDKSEQIKYAINLFRCSCGIDMVEQFNNLYKHAFTPAKGYGFKSLLYYKCIHVGHYMDYQVLVQLAGLLIAECCKKNATLSERHMQFLGKLIFDLSEHDFTMFLVCNLAVSIETLNGFCIRRIDLVKAELMKHMETCLERDDEAARLRQNANLGYGQRPNASRTPHRKLAMEEELRKLKEKMDANFEAFKKTVNEIFREKELFPNLENELKPYNHSAYRSIIPYYVYTTMRKRVTVGWMKNILNYLILLVDSYRYARETTVRTTDSTRPDYMAVYSSDWSSEFDQFQTQLGIMICSKLALHFQNTDIHVMISLFKQFLVNPSMVRYASVETYFIGYYTKGYDMEAIKRQSAEKWDEVQANFKKAVKFLATINYKINFDESKNPHHHYNRLNDNRPDKNDCHSHPVSGEACIIS